LPLTHHVIEFWNGAEENARQMAPPVLLNLESMPRKKVIKFGSLQDVKHRDTE
jgi:hypothetical protein